MRILLTLPDSFTPSSSCHQMLRRYVNISRLFVSGVLCFKYALRDICYIRTLDLQMEFRKKRLENALLTEQIERQFLFCTVTSRLLHDEGKIHVKLAQLYKVLENWQEMKTVFGRNILIRTDDLLILFDISIAMTRSSFCMITTEITM